MSYRGPVGEVELPRVFEDQVLALFPFWILVLQVNSEAFDVFNPCRESETPHQPPALLLTCPHLALSSPFVPQHHLLFASSLNPSFFHFPTPNRFFPTFLPVSSLPMGPL